MRTAFALNGTAAAAAAVGLPWYAWASLTVTSLAHVGLLYARSVMEHRRRCMAIARVPAGRVTEVLAEREPAPLTCDGHQHEMLLS